MKENPYSKMVEIMKRQGASLNPPSIQIGVVISPNPLIIKIGDLQINKDNVLIADYLLKDYTRIYESSADGETWSNYKIIKFYETLSQDDKLAILPTSDKQTYIILARVVSL